MPIKIPKGFQRRKSSGNVLDEVQVDEPSPSFKVFSRPQTGHKSLDINLATQKPLPSGRKSYEQEDEDLFTVTRPGAPNRTSGGTTNSLSTAPYDSGASPTRLSSSSTIPSSADARSDKNVHPASQTYGPEPPAVPVHQNKAHGFLRNAGRTFSFGMKSPPVEVPAQPVNQAPAAKGRFSMSDGRERAMTTSSVSTATPLRFLEPDLSLDNSGFDNLENMFDGIGSISGEPSPIRTVATENPMAPAGRQLRSDSAHTGRSGSTQPNSIDRAARIESSPYAWTSDHSRDALVHTPSSVNTVVHNSPQLTSGRAFGRPMTATTPISQLDSNVDENMFTDTPPRPRTNSRTTRPSTQASNPSPASSHYTAGQSSNTAMTGTSLQKPPILENDDAVFDPSLLASAQLATRFQESKPAPAPLPGKKVMTAAQFERYRQQQDERHRMNKVFQNHKPESDESDDNYDDVEEDDDTERDRQAAKQRRKQEAHLAVYRQTMMKVTGEGPSPASKPNNTVGNLAPASRSASDLANQNPTFTFDKSPARSSDEDGDEDVPLGILAAHGFPNKNKPPARLMSSNSNPNLRSVMQQHGAASVTGESMKRGSLPVFARHLPEDPYYGASLVNQSNRESLAMSSANLAPSGASTAHPHHPAGLVGVIAGEERARAMRRGSPNAATGTYDLPPSMSGHPGMPRAQTTGSIPSIMVPGMPMMPGMPPMLSPGDHAQLQMSQQMTQMMQMQMQWMQQMQQMMAAQGPNAGMQQAMSNFQTGTNMQRPQSVPLQNPGGADQRTMSILSPPSMLGWNNESTSLPGRPGTSYAPSLAPSERSNIGLASRYRPVSTVQEPEQPWNRRTSTMTSTTFRPWSTMGSGPKQPTSTIRKVPAPVDDEDDEKGWAEMKAKKDQKKKTWKLRKGQTVLQELYNGT